MSALSIVRTIFILEPEVSYEEINERLEKMGYNPVSSQRLRSARCDTKDVMTILFNNADKLGITFKQGVSDKLLYTSLMKGKRLEADYEKITQRFHESIAKPKEEDHG